MNNTNNTYWCCFTLSVCLRQAPEHPGEQRLRAALSLAGTGLLLLLLFNVLLTIINTIIIVIIRIIIIIILLIIIVAHQPCRSARAACGLDPSRAHLDQKRLPAVCDPRRRQGVVESIRSSVLATQCLYGAHASCEQSVRYSHSAERLVALGLERFPSYLFGRTSSADGFFLRAKRFAGSPARSGASRPGQNDGGKNTPVCAGRLVASHLRKTRELDSLPDIYDIPVYIIYIYISICVPVLTATVSCFASAPAVLDTPVPRPM